ncbi:hypothetical protein EON65_36620 [archaeon]|nr:MAG: hypothetical protein EON65_36620 [archaeon]
MADYQNLLSKRTRFLSILDDEIRYVQSILSAFLGKGRYDDDNYIIVTCRVAEETLPSKHAAATVIQRAFRGSSLRSIISKQMYQAILIFIYKLNFVPYVAILLFSFAAGEIQRLFRAAMGRKRAHANDEQKHRERHIAFLHYLCIQLQRSFRGYYSRKYKHDQHRRKLYCSMIAQKNEEVLEKMRQYNSEQAEVTHEYFIASIKHIFKFYFCLSI